MRTIIIAGGTGFLGKRLTQHFTKLGDRVIILTRRNDRVVDNTWYMNWDGKTIGSWAKLLEAADVLINLNGKSVDCRYTERNKSLIYATRLDATAVLGEAVQQCVTPPRAWINAASATIYRHSLDKEMDELTGEHGTGFSVDVCEKWEALFNSIDTPKTRKLIIRTGIVLGKNNGPLVPLVRLAKGGLGGAQGKGDQYFSWLHEDDFAHIVEYLIQQTKTTGVYNVTAPHPIPNKDFMRDLRKSLKTPFGLPTPQWLLEMGAWLIRTETELILKSRRVVPKRLLDSGYQFKFSHIDEALNDLVA